MCYTESNLILPAGKGEVSPMNDRQLLCFLTLSRTLNFTAAARELYCTQPALSYQIPVSYTHLTLPTILRV